MKPSLSVLIIGGGDLASGIAHVLFSCGMQVIITELPEPRMVRRTVCFGSAIYDGSIEIECVKAIKTDKIENIYLEFIPVIVDSELKLLDIYNPEIIIDARMLKQEQPDIRNLAKLTIGIGPGFTVGKNVHRVVETKRGIDLGRVYTNGSALPDTGIPGIIGGKGSERVLRAPTSGILKNYLQIGDIVKEGEKIAQVGIEGVFAAFDGIIRGIAHEGLFVFEGEKIGDIDPRSDTDCYKISDKARAIGGGVLSAIFSYFKWELLI